MDRGANKFEQEKALLVACLTGLSFNIVGSETRGVKFILKHDLIFFQDPYPSCFVLIYSNESRYSFFLF